MNQEVIPCDFDYCDVYDLKPGKSQCSFEQTIACEATIHLYKELYDQIDVIANKISHPYLKIVAVDPGWYQLIVDCDAELTAINPNYVPLQIKEKFGTLRYYHDLNASPKYETWHAMGQVIMKYEKLSEQTCELTGLPGVLMKSKHGIYKTLHTDFISDGWKPIEFRENNQRLYDLNSSSQKDDE